MVYEIPDDWVFPAYAGINRSADKVRRQAALDEA